jgi:hypothetical protein
MHDMLRLIPSIVPKCLKSCFASINFKLSIYKYLTDALRLLELAIWLTKITVQSYGDIDLVTTDMKMQCSTDSFTTMVTIIVPYVLSIL